MTSATRDQKVDDTTFNTNADLQNNNLNKLHYTIMSTHAQVKSLLHRPKKIANQRDLALAYSPGVAVPCLEIEKKPQTCRQIYCTKQFSWCHYEWYCCAWLGQYRCISLKTCYGR